MRMVLNQALQLTYGVPDESGHGISIPGVLAQSLNQGLLSVILENSIQLALSYADQDKSAVETDSLIDLPYVEVATKRLELAQNWMRSVLELDLAAKFGERALQQWLDMMNAQDQLHQAKYAAVITQVDQALTQAQSFTGVQSPSQGDVLWGERERLARITIGKVLTEMGLPLLASFPAPAPAPAGAENASVAQVFTSTYSQWISQGDGTARCEEVTADGLFVRWQDHSYCEQVSPTHTQWTGQGDGTARCEEVTPNGLWLRWRDNSYCGGN